MAFSVKYRANKIRTHYLELHDYFPKIHDRLQEKELFASKHPRVKAINFSTQRLVSESI